MPRPAITAAAGKENVGPTAAAKSVSSILPGRRGVGPRSGTKNISGALAAEDPPPLAAALTGDANSSSEACEATPRSFGTVAAAAAWRSGKRVEAAAVNAVKLAILNDTVPSTGMAAVAAAAAAAATGTAKNASQMKHRARQQQQQQPAQQQQRRRSKPAHLLLAPVPRSSAANKSISRGDGVSKRGRSSAETSGRGGTRRVKQKQSGRGVSRDSKEKHGRSTGEKRQPKTGKPAELAKALPSRGRSDFDLTDDESDAGGGGGGGGGGPPDRAAGSLRRSEAVDRGKTGASTATTVPATAPAPAAGRKKARSWGGGKTTHAKRTREPPGRSPDSAQRARREFSPCGAPATQQIATLFSPRNFARCDRGVSPRGSWHLSTLFGDSDDDGRGGGDRVPHEDGGCNWRLSDDEADDGVNPSAAKRKQKRRRSAVSGETATPPSGKKRRVGCGRGDGVGCRSGSGSNKRSSRGSGGGGQEADNDEAKARQGNSWADRLPPPAVVDTGSTSGGEESKNQDAGQAELEGLRAQFKKVDSHQLNFSL